MADRLLCFYGSLRRGERALQSLGIAERMRWVGPCSLRGTLYDLGTYPALVPGDDLIAADLFEMPDPETLAVLDDYEDYFPYCPEGSLYLRRATSLPSHDLEVETYWFNQPLLDAVPVTGGCWLKWRGIDV